MAARKGTIIEGLYELGDNGEDLGSETRFVGRRMSDGAKVDVRIVGPDASPAARKQFSSVAAILGRVDHRNCLSALGAGQLVDQSLYAVTEMAVAGPLTRLLGQALPDRELAEVGLQLVRGLEHLHNQGIVLGHLTPQGVVLGEQDGRPRLQLVDFFHARVLGQPSPPLRGANTQWVAPELVRGEPAIEASDIYSAGRVLQALSSPTTAPTIVEIIDGLLAEEPGYRPLASEVSFRFTEFVEECSQPFSLEWLPDPEVTTISSGIFDLPVPEGPELCESKQDVPSARPRPNPDNVFEAPPRSRLGLGLGLLAAGVAAAALVFVASSGGNEDPADSPPVGAAAAGPVSVSGSAPTRPGPDATNGQPTKSASDEAQLEGNPIVWLAQVNRTDLGAVLPLRQRKRLLAELAKREGVNERVNQRWNSLLDLWQANDADRPCATFAAALATLEDSPTGSIEEDLVNRIVVPTSAPGSQAGVAPDESCVGLAEAFDAFQAVEDVRESKPRRSSRRRPPKRKPNSATPAAAPVTPKADTVKPPRKSKATPSKPSSVSTKLDDDLRDL